MRLPNRSKRGTPRASSSSCTAELAADCDNPICFPAAIVEPVLVTARKTRSCFSVSRASCMGGSVVLLPDAARAAHDRELHETRAVMHVGSKPHHIATKIQGMHSIERRGCAF